MNSACREFGAPLPLAGEVDAPRAMRSIVPSAAGGGFIRSRDVAGGETPTLALPRKRERE